MNKEQFARYLFQGLGRPYTVAQQSPQFISQTSLLQACLYNHVYDRQSSGTRAQYLFGLITLSADRTFFRQEILSALREPDEAMDLDQLFEFASIFAKQGDTEAKRMLYEQFAQHINNHSAPGAEYLIELDGFKGFRFVAEEIGKVILSNNEHWYDDDYYLRVLEKQLGSAGTVEQLNTLRSTSSSVSIYLDTVEAKRKQRKERPRHRLQLQGKTYAEVKSYIQLSKGKPMMIELRRWSASATEEDLKQVANDLLTAPHEVNLRALLYIFTQRTFPSDAKILIQYMYNNDDIVSNYAVNAISLIKDASVRELGLKLLSDKR